MKTRKIALFAFIVLFFGCNLFINAQQVVWEKSFGWHQTDEVQSIITLPDGYMACGHSDTLGGSWYLTQPHNLWNGYGQLMLIKLNAQGDTVFTKKPGFYTRYTTMAKLPDGNLLVVARGCVPAIDFIGIRVYKFSPDGEVLRQNDYAETYGFHDVADICLTGDGGALIVGCGDPDSGSGNITEGYALRIDPNLNELWRRRFSPSTQTYLRHAELQNHSSNRFLISGTAAPSIYGAWIDSSGNITRQHLYYTDPRGAFLWYASVMQSPDSSVIVSGSNNATAGCKYYLGKYDYNGLNLWADTFSGTCIDPFVNSQGYVFMNTSDTGGYYFQKYTPWGDPISKVTINNEHPLKQRTINCAAWSDNDSAVFAGNVYNRYGSDFYFVKMAGVGNGYVSAVPRLVSEEAVRVSLYPNPAATSFRIGGLRVPQSVQLYNLNGQKVYELTAMPDTDIDVQGLPPGLYIVRLQADGVNMGTKKLVVLK